MKELDCLALESCAAGKGRRVASKPRRKRKLWPDQPGDNPVYVGSGGASGGFSGRMGGGSGSPAGGGGGGGGCAGGACGV